jgi:Sulfotransferase family
MIKYVYICSAGHSGSTLLDLLLGSHSRIASLGEIDHLPKNLALNTLCSCGSPVRSCAVWSEVISRLSNKLAIDLMADPYALNMGYPKASVVIDRQHQTVIYLLRRKILLGLFYLRARFGAIVPEIFARPVESAAENNLLVFDTVRDVLGVDMIVDSSKSYLKAVALYLHDPQSVRILLLTRDGRGVCWSNLKRGVARRQAVTSWRNQYARALPLLKQHVNSEHMLQVKYEDVAASPSTQLMRICAFLEQPFEPQMIDFRGKVHHVTNGNDMRLDGPSQMRVDRDWENRLTSEDLWYFERHAGSLNRELGY